VLGKASEHHAFKSPYLLIVPIGSIAVCVFGPHFPHKFWPIAVSIDDAVLADIDPSVVNPLSEVEIKFVIHDDISLRVNAIGIPVGDPPSSVTAILRGKLLRIIGEQVAVFSTGKLPNRIFPAMGEFF